MPSSPTDICNLALSHIGMEPIADISDNNPSAIACNIFFIPCRDDVFSEHSWAFATAQQALQLLTETIVGWCQVYGYPVNSARVWNVYNECTVCEKEQQEFEKLYSPTSLRNIICSNLQIAIADVTYIVSDTTLWDAKFVMALSWRLAAEIAKPVTGDEDMGAKMMAVYNAMIAEAKRVGYAEKRKVFKPKSALLNSRG